MAQKYGIRAQPGRVGMMDERELIRDTGLGRMGRAIASSVISQYYGAPHKQDESIALGWSKMGKDGNLNRLDGLISAMIRDFAILRNTA